MKKHYISVKAFAREPEKHQLVESRPSIQQHKGSAGGAQANRQDTHPWDRLSQGGVPGLR